MPTKKLSQLNELGPKFFAGEIEPSGAGPTRHVYLRGPRTLHRFGELDFREPQCWFEHAEYELALEHARRESAHGGSQGDALIRFLRERLAVRLDWNDFTRLWSLHLPEGTGVDAFTSVIAAQPLATGAAASVPGLRGGAVQHWLFPVPAWVERRPVFLKGG